MAELFVGIDIGMGMGRPGGALRPGGGPFAVENRTGPMPADVLLFMPETGPGELMELAG